MDLGKKIEKTIFSAIFYTFSIENGPKTKKLWFWFPTFYGYHLPMVNIPERVLLLISKETISNANSASSSILSHFCFPWGQACGGGASSVSSPLVSRTGIGTFF